MNFIIDFYRGLDTINLIIFWGIILVVILLLVFSITIANKNKKLKEILEERKSMDNDFTSQYAKEDIPVINKNEHIEKNDNLYNFENNMKELYHERFIIAHELGHYYKICKAVNERYYKYNF